MRLLSLNEKDGKNFLFLLIMLSIAFIVVNIGVGVLFGLVLRTPDERIDILIKQRQNDLKFQEIMKDDLQHLNDKLNEIRDRQITTETISFSRVKRLYWEKQVVSRGGSMIDRINRRLAGTPMAGTGRDYVIAAADYGHSPRLLVAIALHESGAGRYTPPGSHNPYGMTAGTAPGYPSVAGKGPDGTRAYQAFPSFRVAIVEHAKFVKRMWGSVQNPRRMKGYALDSGWFSGVENQMASI